MQAYPTLLTLNILLCFLSFFNLKGQQPADRLTGITQRPLPVYQAPEFKTTTVLNLPVIDDFSYDGIWPDQTIWTDRFVYVNQTLAISPPTLGVATFDGLDEFGLPYDPSRNPKASDTADMLTSCPIDLSSVTDSVYLSFYYQTEGLGERPQTVDSLALYFYHPIDSTWTSVWRTFGGNNAAPFELVMIPVADTFHLNEFQFRFISYGSQVGAFDHWHIDRVLLDDQRTFADTLFTDVAFNRPHPSLLKGYEAVPWFHYDNTLASVLNVDEVTLFYRKNLLAGASSPLNLCVYRVTHQGNTLVEDNLGDITKDDLHQPNRDEFYVCPVGDFLLPAPPVDEFEIQSVNTYTGNALANKGPNDSIVRRQIFKNYYAYDDGSAEKIYTVDGNAGGYILVKYDVRQADELKGLYIHFLKGETDASDNDFQIAVFENNLGEPGNLIYLSDSVYTPLFVATNFFTPYVLDTSGIQITGSVFIGIKQRTITNMTIGFDINYDSRTTIFYGKPPYIESSRNGNMMMRPFFRYLPKDLQLPETTKPQLNFALFPNPAESVINLDWQQEEGEQYFYTIRDISGKPVATGLAQNRLSVDKLKGGFYLITLSAASGKFAPVSKKFVISR